MGVLNCEVGFTGVDVGIEGDIEGCIKGDIEGETDVLKADFDPSKSKRKKFI